MVSVIIPSYNRKNTILSSINSVLNQTYSNIEVIVVDDCSDDGTEEVIKKINDKRVKYIKCDKNQGVATARNIGLQNAVGDYIAFNDSDDIWKENKLELQMKELEEHPEYGMVYCAFSRNKGQREIYRMPSDDYQLEKLNGNVFDFLLNGIVIGTPTMLLKREVFDEVGNFFKELRILDDYDFALRVTNKYLVGYVNEVLVDTYELEDTINAVIEKNIVLNIETYLYLYEYWCNQGKAKDKLKPLYLNAIDNIKYLNEGQLDALYKLVVPKYFSSYEELKAFGNKERIFHRNQFKDYIMNYIFSEKVKYIVDYLKEKNVAIYGNGYIGKCLYYIFKRYQVNVKCIIDRVIKEEEYPVVELQDLLEGIDTVVLSVYDPIRKIEMEIQKQHPVVEIVYISDLISTIERRKASI